MQHTMEEIVKIIDLDEPDYSKIVEELSVEDVPSLIQLSKSSNLSLSLKALSCLSYFQTPAAISTLETISKDEEPLKRLIVAKALGKSFFDKQKQLTILNNLLDDTDLGVRKNALTSVGANSFFELYDKINYMLDQEQNYVIKDLGQQILQKLR